MEGEIGPVRKPVVSREGAVGGGEPNEGGVLICPTKYLLPTHLPIHTFFCYLADARGDALLEYVIPRFCRRNNSQICAWRKQKGCSGTAQKTWVKSCDALVCLIVIASFDCYYLPWSTKTQPSYVHKRAMVVLQSLRTVCRLRHNSVNVP